jgi:hypothetical protein
MPEAAVDEDDRFIFRQDDIRFARQSSDVQPKALTHPMQQPPDDKLRGSVLPADPAHVPGAAFQCQLIAACLPDLWALDARRSTSTCLSHHCSLLTDHWSLITGH